MEGMASQMEALDEFVTKARSQNGFHHEAHLNNIKEFASNVRNSYKTLDGGFTELGSRVRTFEDEIVQQKDVVSSSVAPFSEDIRQPLEELRDNIQNAPIAEYKTTGTTPPRITYDYPTTLPRTETHGTLIAKLRQVNQPALSPLEGEEPGPLLGSPSKTRVYNDAEDEVGELQQPTITPVTSSNTGLREVDINVAARPLNSSTTTPGDFSAFTTGAKHNAERDDDATQPPYKKQQLSSDSKLPQKIVTRRMAGGIPLDGRENTIPLTSNNGRRLRSRPSVG
jgi:kinesin family protein 11